MSNVKKAVWNSPYWNMFHWFYIVKLILKFIREVKVWFIPTICRQLLLITFLSRSFKKNFFHFYFIWMCNGSLYVCRAVTCFSRTVRRGSTTSWPGAQRGSRRNWLTPRRPGRCSRRIWNRKGSNWRKMRFVILGLTAEGLFWKSNANCKCIRL